MLRRTNLKTKFTLSYTKLYQKSFEIGVKSNEKSFNGMLLYSSKSNLIRAL